MENEHGRTDLLTQKQIDWCNEHCDFEWFVKDDGKIYFYGIYDVKLKNKFNIVSFPVKFGDCDYFDCSYCGLLKSLEGTSDLVVKGFDCSYCYSLKSLEGAPKKVNGWFVCSFCKKLISLEGVPKKVDGYFSCSNCCSLESLKGMPEEIGTIFYFNDCTSLKSIDELKNMKINKKTSSFLAYIDSIKIEKYDPILSDMNVFRKWQKTDLTTDEFLKEYDGFLQAKKYGI